MNDQLKILFVEDSSDDIELLLLELEKNDINVVWERVESKKELINALERKWDIIISDYIIPGFSGPEALKIIRERFECTPVIIVSGIVGEEVAVETLKNGATDYLMKNNLVRLIPAINRAIKECQIKLENKKAEETIKKDKERIESIFRASPIGIGVVVNRVLTEVNDMFCQLVGYSKKELVGMDVRSLYLSQEAYEIAGHNIYNEINETGYKSLKVKWKHKNGNIIDLLLSLAPIHKNDLSKGVTYTASDITEQNRAELLQKIIYNISQAANTAESLDELINIIKDQLQVIIDFKNFYVAFYNESNDTFTSPYMLDEKDNMATWPSGKSLTAYVYKSQKPVLYTKEDITKLEDLGKVKVVGALPEVWLGVPLKLKGKTYGVFAIQNYENKDAYSNKDLEMLEFVSHQMSISIERKKAEKELKIAYKKAMESDRLKSAFLATMSHELRTPLNAVIGFSDLIKENLTMDKIIDFAGIVNRSGRHLLEIIEDIFDVTLLEVGQINLIKEIYSIKSLMQSISELAQAEQLKTNNKTKLIYKPTEDENEIFISTDKSKFKQIIINLIKNAIKFTHEGFIEYGYEKIEENSIPFLRFYVKDTGIGIANDKQEIIFNIFRQVDETLTRDFGGTGIGLFVVKRFTEILGGKVELESEEGKGSIFYVTLPYAGLQREIEDVKQESENTLAFSDKTILIAEDDIVSAELLKEMFLNTIT